MLLLSPIFTTDDTTSDCGCTGGVNCWPCETGYTMPICDEPKEFYEGSTWCSDYSTGKSTVTYTTFTFYISC